MTQCRECWLQARRLRLQVLHQPCSHWLPVNLVVDLLPCHPLKPMFKRRLDETVELSGRLFFAALTNKVDVIGLRAGMIELCHPLGEDHVSPQLVVDAVCFTRHRVVKRFEFRVVIDSLQFIQRQRGRIRSGTVLVVCIG